MSEQAAWEDYLAEVSAYLEQASGFAPGPPPVPPGGLGPIPDDLRGWAGAALERSRALQAALVRRRAEVAARIAALPNQPLVRDWA